MGDCIYRAATIGGFHTWRDFRAVIQNSDIVGSPTPNTNYVDVPGGNGHIDLTEALTGDVTYSNWTLTFELAMKTRPYLWPQITNQIYNALHGKAVQVILDEEPAHYFYGRVTVESAARSQIAGQVVLSVDCEPYRYEIQETSVTFTGNGERQCVLTNDRMWVSPTVTASASCSMVFGSTLFSLAQGEHKRADIVLRDGENQFYLFGDASVTFRYRKGCL